MRHDLYLPTYWNHLWLGSPPVLERLRSATVAEVELAKGNGQILPITIDAEQDMVGVAVFVDESAPAALARDAVLTRGRVTAASDGGLAVAAVRMPPAPSATLALPPGDYRVELLRRPELSDEARAARLATLVGPGAMAEVARHRRWVEVAAVSLALLVAVGVALKVGWWAVLGGPVLGFVLLRLVMNRAPRWFAHHPAWQALAAATRKLAAEAPDVVVVLEKQR